MDQPNSRHPMALAMEWVSRIGAVALEMVLPGLAGKWLGERWGIPGLALVGFGLGITVAIWHLLVMTGSIGRKGPPGGPSVGKDKSA